MKEFTLRVLPFGALCIVGDNNLPARAAALGSLDIDQDMKGVLDRCNLPESDRIIDVGAFVGDTALTLCSRGNHVFAFEPFVDAYTAMLYNTYGKNVSLFNAPCGNGETVRYIYECPGPNFGMRSVRECERTHPDAVQSYKLDWLMDRPDCGHIGLMKIDCEGSEIPTLLGARELIKHDRPFLYVEYFKGGQEWRGFGPNQLEETIKSLGYKLEVWGSPPRWDWMCSPL